MRSHPTWVHFLFGLIKSVIHSHLILLHNISYRSFIFLFFFKGRRISARAEGSKLKHGSAVRLVLKAANARLKKPTDRLLPLSRDKKQSRPSDYRAIQNRSQFRLKYTLKTENKPVNFDFKKKCDSF